MAKILTQIPEQNFELIRDKIKDILTDELDGQTYTQDVSVFSERFIPFDKTELPAINVSFDSVPYDRHDQKSRHGENQYYIDIVVNKVHTETEQGDVQASLKLQRITGIIAYILSSPEYRFLDFDPGTVQSRWVEGINIGRLQDQDALHTIVSRITFKVRASESVGSLTGVAGEVYSSQVKLDNTDKGHLIQK